MTCLTSNPIGEDKTSFPALEAAGISYAAATKDDAVEK